MAINIHEALQKASEEIKKTGAQTPLLDAEVLLCYILKWDRLQLLVNRSKPLTTGQIQGFSEAVRRRVEGSPVQYITNVQEFMGLDFYVEEGVLIPRPDTEILVEEVINYAKNMTSNETIKIADLGTGSGAITVSLAKYIPSAFVYSVDISHKALDIAARNAQENHVLERISFLGGDLTKPLEDENLENALDILVSNPPYIPRDEIDHLQMEVAKYEPRLALDGGIDGLDFYRRIIDQGPIFIKNGGFMALEAGHDQAEDIKKIMESNGKYINIKKIKDLAGIERVVTATIIK